MRRKAKRKHVRHHHHNGRNVRNVIYLLLSLAASVYILTNESFHQYLLHLGNWEYLGALIAGFFFVSTFTVAPATVVLWILAETLPIWVIATIAGVGAMLGDFLLLQFFRNDDIAGEINDLFVQLGGRKLRHLLYSRYLRWTLPVIGAFIIMSPLPDELGIGFLGISKLKPKQFLVLAYILDTVGILLLLSLSVVIKP